MTDEHLEERLREEVSKRPVDRTHDLDHVRRVWRTCERIVLDDALEVDRQVLMAAAYLHDIVCLPKDSDKRRLSSSLAADESVRFLADIDFPKGKVPQVSHAIVAHSHSAGVVPVSTEAKVLQDADRIDALGAIGIARTFYTGGLIGSRLFDAVDPLARHRRPEEREYAVDHFLTKSCKLLASMRTSAGKRIASARLDYLSAYLDRLSAEALPDARHAP